LQSTLKEWAKKGILLGIISKNEETMALKALNSHPDMILRQEDFAGWRINWDDKAQNVYDLVEELNLGLESAVFIDDSAAERARVKEALPEVLVSDAKDGSLDPRWFNTSQPTPEDIERVQMYNTERVRQRSKRKIGSVEEWLKSLDIRVTVESLTAENLPRVVQLMNKTNQMNLSSRRLSEEELFSWQSSLRRVVAFRASDRFGSYGIVGVIGAEWGNVGIRVVDFLLSCRVFGRGIAETMLAYVITCASKDGAPMVRLSYVKTGKNRPCLEFFLRSGLDYGETHQQFTWHPGISYYQPDYVTLT
jgi:FkbH-like protein